MTSQPSSVLILFDIDGTLLRTGDTAHQHAFIEAFEEVYGLPVKLEGVPMAGMLDANIARALFDVHELDHAQADLHLERMMTSMGGRYRKAVLAAELRERLLPGVNDAVAACAARGWATGVLTGNARSVAYAKLEGAGLADLLVTGAFGDSARERGHLVEIAIAAAAEATGIHFLPEQTVLVGDTPQDINAAREAGSRIVAVATGRFDVHALAQLEPDALLSDLSDTLAFVKAIETMFAA